MWLNFHTNKFSRYMYIRVISDMALKTLHIKIFYMDIISKCRKNINIFRYYVFLFLRVLLSVICTRTKFRQNVIIFHYFVYCTINEIIRIYNKIKNINSGSCWLNLHTNTFPRYMYIRVISDMVLKTLHITNIIFGNIFKMQKKY